MCIYTHINVKLEYLHYAYPLRYVYSCIEKHIKHTLDFFSGTHGGVTKG